MIPLAVMAAGDARDDAAGVMPRAAQVGDAWRPDLGSIAIWRYSANFLYTLTIGGERFFLRVAPDSERDPDRLRREAAMLTALAAAGWTVPAPVPAPDGRLLVSATAGGTIYHALLLPVIPGALREPDELTHADLATWGATLGRLHTALRALPADAVPDRIAWHAEREMITAALPSWPAPVRAAAARCLAWIDLLPTTGPDYGLIHGDFELDNLPWDQAGPNVIDFDEAGASWYAADIAFAMRDLTSAGETASSPRLAAFLAGYASARDRPAQGDIATQLPQFSQWARLATLARISRARPDDPAALPPWAAALDTRLGALAAEYTAAIVAADSSLGLP